jgi:hypothetical protein
MSKLVSPSVSDSFNAPGSGPGNPANVNWQMVAICGGIAITTAVVFALVINHSSTQTSREWQIQVKSMNDAHLTSVARKDEMIVDLFKTLKKLGIHTKMEPAVSESNSIVTKQIV